MCDISLRTINFNVSTKELEFRPMQSIRNSTNITGSRNAGIMFSVALLIFSTITTTAKAFSWFNRNIHKKIKMEAIVLQYFEGVNKKDPQLIRSCFGLEATIHDIVVSDKKRVVSADVLTHRCMDFCRAHPDCHVAFHYG